MTVDFKKTTGVVKNIMPYGLNRELFMEFNCIYWTTGNQYDKMI